MRKPTSRLLTVASAVSTCCLLVFAALPARAECVEFSSDAWNLRDAVVSEHLGRMWPIRSSRSQERRIRERRDRKSTWPWTAVGRIPDSCSGGSPTATMSGSTFVPHVTAQQPDALQYAPVFNGADVLAALLQRRWVHRPSDVAA